MKIEFEKAQPLSEVERQKLIDQGAKNTRWAIAMLAIGAFVLIVATMGFWFAILVIVVAPMGWFKAQNRMVELRSQKRRPSAITEPLERAIWNAQRRK